MFGDDDLAADEAVKRTMERMTNHLASAWDAQAPLGAPLPPPCGATPEGQPVEPEAPLPGLMVHATATNQPPTDAA